MNYESGVMAEKGEPITVGLDEEHVEFENSERRGRRRIYIIAGLLVLGLAIIAFFLTAAMAPRPRRGTRMPRRLR